MAALAVLLASYILFLAISEAHPVRMVFGENGDALQEVIENIVNVRNRSILDSNIDMLKPLYHTGVTLGKWAYEHEVKKTEYLNQWSEKQGVRFVEINPRLKINRVQEKGSGLTVNFTLSNEYRYVYIDRPGKVNSFRLGTYHSMDLIKSGEGWLITREWYTDPFADSLGLKESQWEKVRDVINQGTAKDFSNIGKRRLDAVAYANKYCGAAAENFINGYNKKYRNYNPLGGDCANFVSQALYEGGKFRKTGTWNYGKEGSQAWINAQALKNYLLYSGRASLVARGSYEKVLSASYRLLPGDIIAYEQKGKIKHVSMVTGADSKGYILVNCHNVDRYMVPWDLGWSDKGIVFHLIRVHY